MRGWRLGGLILGGLALTASLAPGPRQDPASPTRPPATPAQVPGGAGPPQPTRAELAQSRAEAANKAVELAWVYYSENRIDADKLYRWSHRAWEAERDAATDAVGRGVAAEHHLDRMLKLESKIGRIRQLGFGNSLDVAEVVYYVREAYLLRAEAQSERR